MEMLKTSFAGLFPEKAMHLVLIPGITQPCDSSARQSTYTGHILKQCSKRVCKIYVYHFSYLSGRINRPEGSPFISPSFITVFPLTMVHTGFPFMCRPSNGDSFVLE